MHSVFILEHLNILPSGEECVKFIGVYRTRDAAIAAVERLRLQPGFCKYPRIVDNDTVEDARGFQIGEHELDKDHWTEGFVTMVGDEEYTEE